MGYLLLFGFIGRILLSFVQKNGLCKIGVFGHAPSIDKPMSHIAGNALKEGAILEAKKAVGLVVVAGLALVAAVQKVPIGAFLAFLCRYANLAIFHDVVAEIALDFVALGGEVHLVVAGVAALFGVA